MDIPLLVVSIAQVSLGLRDSNFAPSGMEIAVYGIFVTHTLFVSLTTGVGITIPAAQAGAKGKADATDSVAGTRVGVDVSTTAVGVT